MALANTQLRDINQIRETELEAILACPLCNGTKFRILPTPGRWISDSFHLLAGSIGLVSCRSCDLVFTNPRPSGRLLTAFYSGDTYSCHDPSLVSAGDMQADVILSRVTKFLPVTAPKTCSMSAVALADFCWVRNNADGRRMGLSRGDAV